jgi:hypothetical protein
VDYTIAEKAGRFSSDSIYGAKNASFSDVYPE